LVRQLVVNHQVKTKLNTITVRNIKNYIMNELYFQKKTFEFYLPFKNFFLPLGLLFLLLICSTIQAQETPLNSISSDKGIVTIDALFVLLRADSISNNSNRLRVECLIKDIQPSIYISSENGIDSYGENPICLFIDAKSLSNNRLNDLKINQIEIVTIKINDRIDLNSIIDLSVFNHFKNLKYIYILSSVKSTEADIIKLVRNNESNYYVFYDILKTS